MCVCVLGRSYLAKNSELIAALITCLKTEMEDMLTQDHTLGCLQRLSLKCEFFYRCQLFAALQCYCIHFKTDHVCHVHCHGIIVFSEHESSLYVIARPSVCRLSVTLVHPTQATEIFGNVSMTFGTLAISDLSVKILRRSSQGNPSVRGVT